MKSQKLYGTFKQWFEKSIKVRQPHKSKNGFIEQLINLEPIFDTKTHLFSGSLQNDLNTSDPVEYLHLFELGLENITYWHFHGRAIKSLLPLPIGFFQEEDFYEQFEQLLLTSQLPVGLIRLPLIHYKNREIEKMIDKLLKLKRLGIILELKDFSGTASEMRWLKSHLFKGVHFSTALLRAASMASLSKELFDQIMQFCKEENFHTYGEGISLVHDFTFTKQNGIDSCYGPLLMPAVSKHQLLKIHTSQFNDA